MNRKKGPKGATPKTQGNELFSVNSEGYPSGDSCVNSRVPANGADLRERETSSSDKSLPSQLFAQRNGQPLIVSRRAGVCFSHKA